MNTLRLPRAVYDDLRAHGEQTYPQECCGALLGSATPHGWQIVSHIRTRNLHAASPHAASVTAGNARDDSARDRYEIAPAELVEIVYEARRRGLEIAGFYHSHPDHAPRWSPADLIEAHWLDCSYVITEIAQGKAAFTSAFRLAGTTEDDKHFEPQSLQIDDAAADPIR